MSSLVASAKSAISSDVQKSTAARQKKKDDEALSKRAGEFSEEREARRSLAGAAGAQRGTSDADLLGDNRRAKRRDTARKELLG